LTRTAASRRSRKTRVLGLARIVDRASLRPREGSRDRQNRRTRREPEDQSL